VNDLDSAVLRLAQRNETAIIKALQEVTQARVADLIGVSQSVLSEFKIHIPRMAAMLAASGLRVVPSSDQFYDEDYIRSLRVLARAGIDSGGGVRE
jgi:hypothetical protein